MPGRVQGGWAGWAEPRLTLGVLVAEGCRAHVTQPHCALTAAVDENIALVRVALGCRDHFRQLLHVGRLDVHDICV